MTQRIFDIENEKDMQDLWDILPDNIIKAEVGCGEIILITDDGIHYHIGNFIAINWHNKTEITRPVDYESMIGCVGWFGSKEIKTTLSILKSVDCTYGNPWFECKDGKHWDDFTPAKKSELKFWENKE